MNVVIISGTLCKNKSVTNGPNWTKALFSVYSEKEVGEKKICSSVPCECWNANDCIEIDKAKPNDKIFLIGSYKHSYWKNGDVYKTFDDIVVDNIYFGDKAQELENNYSHLISSYSPIMNETAKAETKSIVEELALNEDIPIDDSDLPF